MAIRSSGEPNIAKSRGYCTGGGNSLNVLCDLTISGESGRFDRAGPQIGSAHSWWGCQLMPAVVGSPTPRPRRGGRGRHGLRRRRGRAPAGP